MTRTKKPQKNSIIKKQPRQNVLNYDAASSDLDVSVKRSEDLNVLLAGSYESTDNFLKKFELYYEKKLEAHRRRYESACEYVEVAFKETMLSWPESYINSTVHSTYDEDLLRVDKNGLNSAVQKDHLSSSHQVDTTECEFKKPKLPRVNRSKQSVSTRPLMAPPSADKFKTPHRNLQALGPMSEITPKVTATPMCVMRRPEHGEVAFSTSGSPLLVGRVSLEDIPTVTVPLQDGRIFSILPDPGAGPPILPEFDEETKKYLKTLQQHLALLAP